MLFAEICYIVTCFLPSICIWLYLTFRFTIRHPITSEISTRDRGGLSDNAEKFDFAHRPENLHSYYYVKRFSKQPSSQQNVVHCIERLKESQPRCRLPRRLDKLADNPFSIGGMKGRKEAFPLFRRIFWQASGRMDFGLCLRQDETWPVTDRPRYRYSESGFLCELRLLSLSIFVRRRYRSF